MTEKLTIQNMTARFDVTPRTLRFYETKELLTPERTNTGQRLYDAHQIERMIIIQHGKSIGMALEDIRKCMQANATKLVVPQDILGQLLQRATADEREAAGRSQLITKLMLGENA